MSNLKALVLEGIVLKSGEVIYNDCEIDPNLPFEDQEWSFKEDILQIKFDAAEHAYTVDVGWNPEFKKNGKFVIQVIKDYVWERPIFHRRVKTFVELKACLQEAITIADEAIHRAIS